jgi:hypothetical protein
MPPAATPGEASGIAPEAASIAEQGLTFLAQQQRFGLKADVSVEAVLSTGQKIQFSHAAKLAVRRPDRLFAERIGELVEQRFFYDGESLTLFNPDDAYYATLAAPPGIDAMLDFAHDTLDLVAPGADLLYTDAHARLMADVESGFVVGDSVIDGVRCTHLAFRAPHVDWQLWVQQQGPPLPRRLVITTRDVVNAPQFTVSISDWNLAPDLDDQVFVFKPPAGAREIRFLGRDGDVVERGHTGGRPR